MSAEPELHLFRGERDIAIAFDLEDAQLVVRHESFYEDDEDIGDFEQVDPDEEIEIEEPDGALVMRSQYRYLPEDAKVFVKAKASDWIASHGRGLLGSSEY